MFRRVPLRQMQSLMDEREQLEEYGTAMSELQHACLSTHAETSRETRRFGRGRSGEKSSSTSLRQVSTIGKILWREIPLRTLLTTELYITISTNETIDIYTSGLPARL